MHVCVHINIYCGIYFQKIVLIEAYKETLESLYYVQETSKKEKEKCEGILHVYVNNDYA